MFRHERHSWKLWILPRVVLLDLTMPGMTGLELARRLRAEHPDRPLGLIAITGYGRSEDHERSRAAGIDAHLMKLINYHKLRGPLREYLG